MHTVVVGPMSFLLVSSDMDVLELLPRYNDLLGSPDLVSAGFSNSNKFQYLMQAGYEQVERVRDVNMAY